MSVIVAFIAIDSDRTATYVCAETLVKPDTDHVLLLSDIELHDGYAEYFEDPPDIIAPANAEWAPIPPEFKIEKRGNRLSLYDEAVILVKSTTSLNSYLLWVNIHPYVRPMVAVF